MPPKMGLRVSSCFHNAFSAVDCQEISGRFWPVSDHCWLFAFKGVEKI